jgi:hypothetical protein
VIIEVNAKFPIRAQKFPAVFTVNINWPLAAKTWRFSYGEFSVETMDLPWKNP